MEVGDILTLIGLLATVVGMIGTSHQILHKRISELRRDIEKDFMPREVADLRLQHMEDKLRQIHDDVRLILGARHPASAE